MTATDLTVARTILEQLGGQRFVAMTGARKFIGAANSLSFRLPRASQGINVVRVILTPADTYDVEFLRVRAGEVTPVETCDGVYCDQLQDIFQGATGLATRFLED